MSVETPILNEGAGGADLIKNTTTKDFMRDVVEASREVPVLVDFWAPWCGPCRQLTPVLEKAVRDAKGAIKLVKLNIDEHPQIPGQMGVQSIPAVFAFQDGRPVDGFMGALPESRINDFIARLVGDTGADAGAKLEVAEAALAAGDLNAAAQAFGEILQDDRENAQALGAQMPLRIPDHVIGDAKLSVEPQFACFLSSFAVGHDFDHHVGRLAHHPNEVGTVLFGPRIGRGLDIQAEHRVWHDGRLGDGEE